MSDDIKFCLKLKLKTGLITPEEIQVWANKKILEDSEDELALDICFLGSKAEVEDYFNKLIWSYLDVYDESLISINILKEYIEKNIKLTNVDLDEYIKNIVLISWHINDEDLTWLVNIHNAQVDLAYSKVIPISVEEAFNEFLQHLNQWLKKTI